VELRDRELTGMVIGSGEISLERIAKLDASFAQPQWAALPHTQGQPWIMNLSNGHVFNGSGHRGYAWCVQSAASLQPG
jgi:hypothetical protein